MNPLWPFDQEDSMRISERRREFLEDLLKALRTDVDLETALDAGCGVGWFSGWLSRLGLRTTGLDARAENIEEARRRHPDVDFHVRNVESGGVREHGAFDLVLCFGLLYHLENPFAAIRNLSAAAAKLMIVESLVAPCERPMAFLMNECRGRDQGLRYVAFVPSEACLIKMLYKSGFSRVYKARRLPDHDDFRETRSHRRRRTVLIASRLGLRSPLLQHVGDPEPQRPDIWEKKKRSPSARRGRRGKGGFLSLLRRVRRGLLRLFPKRHRLPWGGWWLETGDVRSEHVRLGDDSERGEQGFLLAFLRPGMTFFDLGAHHGFYTLLASTKVGATGRVFAFEPSPRERRRLQRHLELNRCTNVVVEPMALGEREGVADLFVCLGRETGCNSLRPPAVSEPTRPVRVPVTTLDRYQRGRGPDQLDFIKLDVEGAELDVLKGAPGLLGRRPRPLIMCELADVRTEPWGYRSARIHEYLTARDYEWFSVTKEGLLRACPRREHFSENLLAVPVEKLELVSSFGEGAV